MPALPENLPHLSQHQDDFYGENYDYRVGSPHLKHAQLWDMLIREITAVLVDLTQHGLPLAALEVGAGHGAFVEQLLARGCRVLATEMARSSVERLSAAYGPNSAFRAIHDPDGSLRVMADERVSLVLFASVLHHMPDYLSVLDVASKHLHPGGALITLQDPLWYPRMQRSVRVMSELLYLAWRVPRGNYVRGIKSRVRRLRKAYDPANPSDMVEYQVVRDGVDEDAIADHLRRSFQDVRVLKYWSSQSAIGQWVGEALGVTNTFAIVARDHISPELH